MAGFECKPQDTEPQAGLTISAVVIGIGPEPRSSVPEEGNDGPNLAATCPASSQCLVPDRRPRHQDVQVLREGYLAALPKTSLRWGIEECDRELNLSPKDIPEGLSVSLRASSTWFRMEGKKIRLARPRAV